MHKKVREMMNAYEKENPDHRALNDLAAQDLKSLGIISPAKPFAMHVAHTLDGHHDNRKNYSRNYDEDLQAEEKNMISEEMFDLAELSAMLHDPEYVIDDSSDNPSDNHKMSQEILADILMNHGPEESHDHLVNELINPLLNVFMDKSINEKGILHSLLSPTMVKGSKHSKEDYSQLLKTLLLIPVLEGHSKQHWKKKLPAIFEALGEKNG